MVHRIKRFINKFGINITFIKKEKLTHDIEKKIREQNIINIISPNYTVLSGPFKGMKYPRTNFNESSFLPKIVGSYESQLHPILDKIFVTNYSDIIDVGCAEGYYAAGFGMRMKKALVHAYDTNEKDLEVCKEMATLNNVENIKFYNRCDSETLIQFKDAQKILVFCDVEGYELELINETVIANLKNADYLIELHDVVNPEISMKLYDRFAPSHNLIFYNNRGVNKKKYFDNLESLNSEDQQFALQEHRGGVDKNIFMEWVFITSKLSN